MSSPLAAPDPQAAAAPDLDSSAASLPLRPWGAGMTLVFGGVIFLAYSILQGMALVPVLLFQLAQTGGKLPKVGGVPMTGLSLAVAVAVSCPAMLFLCGLFAALRRGPSIGDYLALKPVRWTTLTAWTIGMIVLSLTLSVLGDLLGRSAPEFMVATYSTAGHLPLFWAAVAIAAPAAEEAFFRGFLFPGLLQSRLGRTGTVLLTSLTFTIVHGGQYDAFELFQVGLVGVSLGIARLRTGSLLPPLAMHVTLNLLSLTLFALQ
jgi:membrane protease YdiL (CAAX protease family)